MGKIEVLVKRGNQEIKISSFVIETLYNKIQEYKKDGTSNDDVIITYEGQDLTIET